MGNPEGGPSPEEMGVENKTEGITAEEEERRRRIKEHITGLSEITGTPEDEIRKSFEMLSKRWGRKEDK